MLEALYVGVHRLLETGWVLMKGAVPGEDDRSGRVGELLRMGLGRGGGGGPGAGHRSVGRLLGVRSGAGPARPRCCG